MLGIASGNVTAFPDLDARGAAETQLTIFKKQKVCVQDTHNTKQHL